MYISLFICKKLNLLKCEKIRSTKNCAQIFIRHEIFTMCDYFCLFIIFKIFYSPFIAKFFIIRYKNVRKRFYVIFNLTKQSSGPVRRPVYWVLNPCIECINNIFPLDISNHITWIKFACFYFITLREIYQA